MNVPSVINQALPLSTVSTSAGQTYWLQNGVYYDQFGRNTQYPFPDQVSANNAQLHGLLKELQIMNTQLYALIVAQGVSPIVADDPQTLRNEPTLTTKGV